MQNAQGGEQPVYIPVQWMGLENVPTVYANNMVITHAGKEFYLVFGEAIVPILLNPEVDPKPDIIPIRPLVKIAIVPELMVQFASIITENVSKYLERVSAEFDDSDETDDSRDENA